MGTKLSDRQIIGIVQAELQNSIDFSSNKSVAVEQSLKYYTGAPNGKEKAGKSAVVSTDVADAIEWLMPQIMNALTQNNQVVDFDATSPDDELQSKIESKYCHDTVMKYNEGFIEIYQTVKDSLLNKNGLFKIFYESEDRKNTAKYSGLSDDQFALLVADDSIDIIEHSSYVNEYGTMHDVKVSKTVKKGCINVVSVPLEEFRVNANHGSIKLDNARFTAHITKKTISDLILEGYKKEQLKSLPEYEQYNNYIRFQFDEESVAQNAKSDDEALKEVAISECYMQIDINGDGIAEYSKITLAGSDSGTLIVLSKEELDYCPWVSCSPILMSHKFLGLSIYDRLKEIQDQKTALLRNMFDNFYLQNNQRYKVLENQVDLKDLLISRAGGIVKVKSMDAIMPLETNQFGAEALNLMNYLDTIRSGRVGVSAEGSTAPQNIGDRVGSIGVDKLMTAKEELVNLIIRVIAETGIKPLMFKVRELARAHFDTELHYKFRDEWVKINPSLWQDRSAASIRVGTGTGNKNDKIEAIKAVMDIQSKVLSNPMQTMVDESQIFSAINEFCELTGLISATKYFVNPDLPQAKQKRQQLEQSAAQEKQVRSMFEAKLAESQIKLGDAEVQKSQAQMMNVQLKARLDEMKLQQDYQKMVHQLEVAQLKQQLDEAKALSETSLKSKELELKEKDIDTKAAIELTKIEATSQSEQNRNYEQNSQTIENSEGSDDTE